MQLAKPRLLKSLLSERERERFFVILSKVLSYDIILTFTTYLGIHLLDELR